MPRQKKKEKEKRKGIGKDIHNDIEVDNSMAFDLDISFAIDLSFGQEHTEDNYIDIDIAKSFRCQWCTTGVTTT